VTAPVLLDEAWSSERTTESDEQAPAPRAAAGALLLLVAIAVPVALALNVSVGRVGVATLVVLITSPLWFPEFTNLPQGARLVVALMAYAVSGVVLSWVAVTDHDVLIGSGVIYAISVTTSLCGVGALVWAARRIGTMWVVVLFGLVRLVVAMADRQLWGVNAWKFAFAAPITLIALPLAGHRSRLLAQLAVLSTLGALSVYWDYRSAFAVFLVTAGLVIAQRVRLRPAREWSLWARLILVASAAVTLYYALSHLLISGLLGAEVTDRSRLQVQEGGTLLLGGRPEWTVTVRLLESRPFGYGFGTVPSPTDVELGREGFAGVKLLGQVGYLKNYVLSGGFRLHSITADLWATGGVLGVVVAVIMLWILVTALSEALGRRRAAATTIYLTLFGLWDLLFGTTYTNLPDVMLALAVAISGLVSPSSDPGTAPSPDPGPSRLRPRTQSRSVR
jgi:hypothetical protein